MYQFFLVARFELVGRGFLQPFGDTVYIYIDYCAEPQLPDRVEALEEIFISSCTCMEIVLCQGDQEAIHGRRRRISMVRLA